MKLHLSMVLLATPLGLLATASSPEAQVCDSSTRCDAEVPRSTEREASKRRGSPLGREHALLQVGSRADWALRWPQRWRWPRGNSKPLEDDNVSQHAGGIFSSRNDASVALRAGLHSAAAALDSFGRGEAHDGFVRLGSGLFEVVKTILPAEMKESPEFDNFTALWNSDVETVAQAHTAELGAFMEAGSADAAVTALTSALFELSGTATEGLPPKSGETVATYLAALVDALEGAGEGVDLAEEGQQVEGMEALYAGMRGAVSMLVTDDLQDEESSDEIIKSTDPEMGSIVKSLVSVVRVIIDSRVCWKRTVRRERSRPEICGENFHVIDNRWCAADEGGAKTHWASCNTTDEARGAWCYAACPVGYETSFNHCKQKCGGSYWVESPLLCGDTEDSVKVALTEMAAKTAIAAATQVGLAAIAKDVGLVVIDHMSTVLDGFIELAKPFGHPKCPDDLA